MDAKELVNTLASLNEYDLRGNEHLSKLHTEAKAYTEAISAYEKLRVLRRSQTPSSGGTAAGAIAVIHQVAAYSTNIVRIR